MPQYQPTAIPAISGKANLKRGFFLKKDVTATIYPRDYRARRAEMTACGSASLNTALPATSASEPASNVTYPDAFIKEVEHDDRLYEIILSNGFELTFNSSLKLIDIDK